MVVGGCHAVAVDAEGRATRGVVCNARRIAVHVPRRVGHSSDVVLAVDAGGRARVVDTSLVMARQPRRPQRAGDEATIFISARMRGCATEDARMRGRFSGQVGAALPRVVLTVTTGHDGVLGRGGRPRRAHAPGRGKPKSRPFAKILCVNEVESQLMLKLIPGSGNAYRADVKVGVDGIHWRASRR